MQEPSARRRAEQVSCIPSALLKMMASSLTNKRQASVTEGTEVTNSEESQTDCNKRVSTQCTQDRMDGRYSTTALSQCYQTKRIEQRLKGGIETTERAGAGAVGSNSDNVQGKQNV